MPVLTCCLFLAAVAGQDAAHKDLNTLSLEVTVMERMDAMGITPEQLAVLAVLAKETAEKPRDRDPARVNLKLRRAVLELHAALVKKKGDDYLTNLRLRVAEIKKKDKVELDDNWETTAAARAKAAEFLRLLKPTQVSWLLVSVDDTDPEELLRDAIRRSRILKELNWTEARNETVNDLSEALGGTDTDRADEIGQQVGMLLDRAHAMKEPEYKKQEARILEEARAMIRKVGPLRILENRATLSVARFLSNPALPAAVEQRLAATPSGTLR